LQINTNDHSQLRKLNLFHIRHKTKIKLLIFEFREIKLLIFEFRDSCLWRLWCFWFTWCKYNKKLVTVTNNSERQKLTDFNWFNFSRTMSGVFKWNNLNPISSTHSIECNWYSAVRISTCDLCEFGMRLLTFFKILRIYNNLITLFGNSNMITTFWMLRTREKCASVNLHSLFVLYTM